MVALQIVALVALAVTLPLLEVLGRGPEFFVAHRLEGGDLGLFVLLVAAAVPAVILLAGWLAGRVHRRLGRFAIGVLRAMLAAAIVLEAVRNLPLPGLALVALALAAGVLIEAGCRRLSSVRLFVALLSPAVVVAPAIFCFGSAASPLLARRQNAFLGGGRIEAKAPVVFLVFDQLPVSSLLDEDGGIDAAAFPNFAALARTATWFRNTSSVSDRTEYALPALLTGRYPRPGDIPTASAHPDNLFTGLAPAFRLHVQEPITRLCPSWLCPDETPRSQRLARALSDSVMVFLHRLLPPDLARGLPEVRHDWSGFWHQTVQTRWVQEKGGDRRPYDWIEGIGPARGQHALHFLHVLLPHEPFVYLPTGQLGCRLSEPHGLLPGEVWTTDEAAVAHNYQRHLLQVGAADHFLGLVLDRLRRVDAFDDALMVVTSDHGASFRPGAHYKRPTLQNFSDIMSVPFLLKLPRQHVGRVSDRPTETVDIVPTLAAALQLAEPPRCDGRSALDERSAPRESVRIFYGGARRQLRVAPSRLAESTLASARRKIELFGVGPAWTPRSNYGAELVGRSVADFEVAADGGLAVGLDSPDLYGSVDPHGTFVPSCLSGAIAPVGERFNRQLLAVTVNGTVVATTRAPGDQDEGEAAWGAVVRPESLRAGRNDVAVYEVDVTKGRNRFVFRRTVPLQAKAW